MMLHSLVMQFLTSHHFCYVAVFKTSRTFGILCNYRNDFQVIHPRCGPGSVVGIATAYGLDGPGIESQWGEIFRTIPDRL